MRELLQSFAEMRTARAFEKRVTSYGQQHDLNLVGTPQLTGRNAISLDYDVQRSSDM